MIAALLVLAAAPSSLAYEAVDFGGDALTWTVTAHGIDVATLSWPRGTALQLEDREGELVVRFDHPLHDAAIQRFQAEAGDRIQSLRWNDTSLLLRPVAGTRLIPHLDGSRLTIGLRSDPERMEQSLEGKVDAAARDLAIVDAQVDLASGYTGRARRKAEQLATRFPQDRDVLRLVADTRAADGDMPRAARTYRRLGADDRAARRVLALAPGNASVGATVRDGTGFAQTEVVGKVTVATDDTTAATLALRRIDTHAVNLVIDNGPRIDVDTGATLADVTASTLLSRDLRVSATGSLWLDTGLAGGDLRMAYGSGDLQLRLGYAYRMPDLSFAEQALHGGRLSQLTLGGSAQILPELRARADFGWRRYGISGTPDAAQTLTAAAQVDYGLLRRPLAITLGYRLDAEYVQRQSHGAGGLALLPLSDRENHTVQVIASGAAGALLLTGGAGWTVDRFGGSGPNASLAAGLPIGVRWQIDAGVGVTSISRPGFPGSQTFGRLELRRALGTGR